MGRFSKNFPERAMYIFVFPTKAERENEEKLRPGIKFYIENNHLGASMIDYMLFPQKPAAGLEEKAGKLFYENIFEMNKLKIN